VSIKEIMGIEADNRDTIYLHKEGLFWRAYEVSAYLFVSHIKEYRPIKKYYRVVEDEVIYIGFPHTSLESISTILATHNILVKDEKLTKVAVSSVDQDLYQSWKKSIDIIEPIIKDAKPFVSDTPTMILKEIASYPLAARTPIEVQRYLYDLQERIISLSI
jgi:hypothetical protein